MATRPVFLPATPETASAPGVVVCETAFLWIAGMAPSQRMKCVRSLHDAFMHEHPGRPVLEVSTKNPDQGGLGWSLSAFNLEAEPGATVEMAYQASKILASPGGDRKGPFHAWLGECDSRELRKRVQAESASRRLVAFQWQGALWPLTPTTLFYDWLYCRALRRSGLDKAIERGRYAAFTDIEFNPGKSKSCQAAAAALYLSLKAFGKLDDALASPETFRRWHPADAPLSPEQGELPLA